MSKPIEDVWKLEKSEKRAKNRTNMKESNIFEYKMAGVK